MARMEFSSVPRCYWRDDVKMTHVERKLLASMQLLVFVADDRMGDVTVAWVKKLKRDYEDLREQFVEMAERNEEAARESEFWYALRSVVEEGDDDVRSLCLKLTRQDSDEIYGVAMASFKATARSHEKGR